MFSLTIALRDNPTVWTLLYKKKETAAAAWAIIIANQFHEITDDYGQALFLPVGVNAALLEDMDESKLAHIERAMHNAHTNADANSRANADPKLRLSVSRPGPAVLTPMAGGMR